MNETLSSALTFFYKYIFTTLWIGGFGLGTFLLFLSNDPTEPRFQFLAAWIIGTSFLLLSVGRCKNVELIGTKLRVSNYIGSKEYDVANIISVDGSLMLTPELIWFKVLSSTGEKRTVVFMPPIRFTFGFTRHPMVKRLRELQSTDIV